MAKKEKTAFEQIEAKEIKIEPTREVVLTPNEVQLLQRVQSEMPDWVDIGEESADYAALGEDPFRIPQEAQKIKDKKLFNFRWIEKSPENIDEYKSRPVPNRWWLVNEMTVPELKKYLDPTLRCILRHGQVLVCMPWHLWEKRVRMMEELNDAQSRSGELQKKNYEAQDGVHFVPDKPISAGDQIEYEEGGEDDSAPIEDLE